MLFFCVKDLLKLRGSSRSYSLRYGGLRNLRYLNSLSLSIVVAAEILTKILADVIIEVLIEIFAAEVLVKLTSGTELV